MRPTLSSDTKQDPIHQNLRSNGTLNDRSPTPAPPVLESGLPDNPTAKETGAQQVWGMTQADRRVVFVMATVLFGLMVVNWIRIVGWRPSNLTVDRPQGEQYRFVVDVNTATWVEWMQLDGIGETMARRIVAHREEHGPFETVEQVDLVPGVGPKTFARIRDQLVCQPPMVGH